MFARGHVTARVGRPHALSAPPLIHLSVYKEELLLFTVLVFVLFNKVSEVGCSLKCDSDVGILYVTLVSSHSVSGGVT